ncbi:MAG: hypothetical protein DMG61_16650 [Acidobacteria bacterium]|nr:MAG: hypothetical protein DMG61_16650 [Acidobacteriota bacterium]PYY14992.1 MAG: hypothetical protein DMG60_18855 [Acidobacteriota bacterium]
MDSGDGRGSGISRIAALREERTSGSRNAESLMYFMKFFEQLQNQAKELICCRPVAWMTEKADVLKYGTHEAAF